MDAEELYHQLKPHIEDLLQVDELTEESDEALADLCNKLVGDDLAMVKAEKARDTDPNRRYQMYTAEGNQAVATMVQNVIMLMRTGQVTRLLLPRLLTENKREVVHLGYPEVHDTEPRGAIADQIDKVCDELGWKGLRE